MEKLISEYGKLHDIKNDIVDRLKSDKKPCKYFYKLYLENIKESPVRSQQFLKTFTNENHFFLL
jgi:hypothetical protein